MIEPIRNIRSRRQITVTGAAPVAIPVQDGQRSGLLLHNSSLIYDVWLKILRAGSTAPTLTLEDRDAVIPPLGTLTLPLSGDLDVWAINSTGQATPVKVTILELDGEVSTWSDLPLSRVHPGAGYSVSGAITSLASSVSAEVEGCSSAMVYITANFSGLGVVMAFDLVGPNGEYVSSVEFTENYSGDIRRETVQYFNGTFSVSVPLAGAKRLVARPVSLGSGTVSITIVPSPFGASPIPGRLGVQGVDGFGIAPTGKPVKGGLEAISADPAAVSPGTVARPAGSLLGKTIQLPFASPSRTWMTPGASGGMTTTAESTIQPAPGAGQRIYVTSMDVSNASATGSVFEVRDGAGGAAIWRGWVPPGAAFAVQIPTPLRGSVNTALVAACLTAGAQIFINAQGFLASE